MLPSMETPANSPRLREYEYTSAVKFWSVPAEAERPTGPAATDASPPSVSLPSAMPSMPLRRGEHQHDVGGLHADLPADVAAGDGDHDGIREPAVGVAHHHGAAAAAAADDGGDLHDVRDDGDAVGARHAGVGDERCRAARRSSSSTPEASMSRASSRALANAGCGAACAAAATNNVRRSFFIGASSEEWSRSGPGA